MALIKFRWSSRDEFLLPSAVEGLVGQEVTVTFNGVSSAGVVVGAVPDGSGGVVVTLDTGMVLDDDGCDDEDGD